MTLISQNIPHLLGGVSQEAPRQKDPSRVNEQVNALSHVIRGLMKRPPTEYIASLGSALSTAYTHVIDHDLTNRFRLIISNGALVVRDTINNTSATVYSPDGVGYLAGSSGFRATTTGKGTYILNKGVTIAKSPEVAPERPPEALVWVREAVAETDYTLKINSTTKTATAPVSGASTDDIAKDLYDQFVLANIGFINLALMGSTIFITTVNGSDFELETSDGLADKGLVPVKGKVQAFSDLPKKAPDGFVVEVVGDPTIDHDNYFAKFSSKGSPEDGGTWEETAPPGKSDAFDGSTMPHVLIRDGAWAEGEVILPPEDPTRASMTYTFRNQLYPPATQFTMTVDQTTVTYTPSETENLREFLNGLKAAIVAAGYGATLNMAQGTLEVTGGATATQASGFAFDEATTLFDDSLTLTVDGLIGREVKNLTDGSTGTITGNTKTTITVSSLTGGEDNTFQEDDEYEVVEATAGYFVFRQVAWAKKTAGSSKGTVDFPSLENKEALDIFSHSGRLGLLVDDTVVLSRAGDYTNFFRQSAVQLLDDDPIDVSAANTSRKPTYHSAVEWHGGLYLFGDNVQIEVSGEPMLTPSTVALRVVGHHPNDSGVKPLVLGNNLFAVRKKPHGPQVLEFYLNREGKMEVVDTTALCPSYISGNPKALVGDSGLGIFVLLTDSPSNALFPCVLLGAGENRAYSWSRWEIPPTAVIQAIDFLDTELGIVSNYDSVAHLETMDLDVGLPDRTGAQVVVGTGSWILTTDTAKDAAAIVVNEAGKYEIDPAGFTQASDGPNIVKIGTKYFLI